MGRIVKKILSIVLLTAFLANACCYGLATLPASENPRAKCEIMASLARRIVRYAESPEALKLLKFNKTPCLLLSSGFYLVTKETAEDDLKLLLAINHEDIEALMQIIARQNPHRYQIIKETILENFLYDRKSELSENLYVNHLVATAFQWLLLVKEGVIAEKQIPDEQKSFIGKAEKIIKKHIVNAGKSFFHF